MSNSFPRIRLLAVSISVSLVSLTSLQIFATNQTVASKPAANDRSFRQACKIVDSREGVPPDQLEISIGQFLKRHSVAEIDRIEKELGNSKRPHLGGLLANLQIRKAISGETSKHWDLKKSSMIFPELLSEIHRLESDIRKATFAQDHPSIPNQWEGYEDLFWEIHVVRNRLKHMVQVASLCIDQQENLLEKTRPADIKPLNHFRRDAIKFDYRAARNRLVKADIRLGEREIEYRIYRIEDSAQLLATEKEKKRRLLAGFALKKDHMVIEKFFDETRPEKIANKDLAEPAVRQAANKSFRDGLKSGQAEIEKGTQLMAALHWWLRGRYGRSSEALGLLKPKAAMINPQMMFGLFMPRKIEAAVMPGQSTKPNPEVERRHFYNWAVEYRPVFVEKSMFSSLAIDEDTGQKLAEHLDRFY